MYWAIRGSQAWNTNDSKIAKRMALLVFTDFICWFPIAFLAITAAFGAQLISLEGAKVSVHAYSLCVALVFKTTGLCRVN
jgi:leucine-rich repeat-containing G protein-coupled receptor 6